MSNCCLIQNMNFDFWKGEWIFTNYSYPCCLYGVWRKWSSQWGRGGMVSASNLPDSRVVVKPINCEYTRILDNMLLLRILGYGFCRWSVILEHRYEYTKRILNSTCKHWCMFHLNAMRYWRLNMYIQNLWLNYKLLYCFESLLILIKS